jgi:predicted flap endonuclease-1-like 5' DNA nuclease
MRSEDIKNRIRKIANLASYEERNQKLTQLCAGLPASGLRLALAELAELRKTIHDHVRFGSMRLEFSKILQARAVTEAALLDSNALVSMYGRLSAKSDEASDEFDDYLVDAVEIELRARLAPKAEPAVEEVVTRSEAAAEKPDAPLPVPAGARANLVSSLPIHTRICRALERHGVKTVEQLAGMTSKEVVAIKGFAGWALDQVRDGLKSRGLSLEDEVLPRPEDGVDIEAYEENEEEEDDDIEDREEEEEEDEEEEEAEESDLVLDRL